MVLDSILKHLYISLIFLTCFAVPSVAQPRNPDNAPTPVEETQRRNLFDQLLERIDGLTEDLDGVIENGLEDLERAAEELERTAQDPEEVQRVLIDWLNSEDILSDNPMEIPVAFEFNGHLSIPEEDGVGIISDLWSQDFQCYCILKDHSRRGAAWLTAGLDYNPFAGPGDTILEGSFGCYFHKPLDKYGSAISASLELQSDLLSFESDGTTSDLNTGPATIALQVCVTL